MTSKIAYLILLITQIYMTCPLEFEITRADFIIQQSLHDQAVNQVFMNTKVKIWEFSFKIQEVYSTLLNTFTSPNAWIHHAQIFLSIKKSSFHKDNEVAEETKNSLGTVALKKKESNSIIVQPSVQSKQGKIKFLFKYHTGNIFFEKDIGNI